MSRLGKLVRIYEEMDKTTERVIGENKDNVELHKAIALANISQSLRNIDITLAELLDYKKGAGNESS